MLPRQKHRWGSTWLAVVFGLGVSALWPAATQGAITPLDADDPAPEADAHPEGPVLPQGVAPGNVSVLVHLAPGANRVGVRGFAAQRGGFVKYEYGTVMPNTINIRNIAPAAVDALKNLPGVLSVEEDKYYPDLVKLDESTPLIRALQTQITGAGYSADGTDIRVCVCDTGIDTDHIMYADRIDFAASYDFNNNDSNPEDDQGHGSHVAGIAVGGTGLSVDFGCEGSEPFQGVAPAATLIGVKILNQFGGGTTSNIIAGIDHCADQSPSGGRADVINLSIGTGNFGGVCDGQHSWADASNNAVDAGVVVVAASGNECNSNSMGSPACGSKVIAVGATYKTDYPNCENSTSTFNWGCGVDSSPGEDDIVAFSNQSDFLDVVGPGSVIWSASNSAGGSSIVGQSGTSMSSPAVAGLAALILSVNPTRTPAEVRQIIQDGAIDMGPPGFDRGYGHGRIDAINSIQLAACNTNGECDDGLFCNGAETCDTGTGSCQPGSDPCPGQGCDEVAGCVPCNDDGTCDMGEDCNSCPGDCITGSGASCGNGICEAADGEDCQTCAADCNGVTGGRPQNRYCCGGPGGQNPVPCSDARCTGGGNTCTDVPAVGSCCGDLTCEGSEGSSNCAVDCGDPPSCGDGNCDSGEDECSCPSDCGSPPATETDCTDGIDNDCFDGTDCDDPDCATDPACLNPCN
ncbi:MAG: S8 family serine peptidase, partial [Planctomycetota bacterium]